MLKDVRVWIAVAGILPLLVFGLIIALAAGFEAIGVVFAIWVGGWFAGYAWSSLDVVDPLFDQTRDAIAQTKRAVAQLIEARTERDAALARLADLRARLDEPDRS